MVSCSGQLKSDEIKSGGTFIHTISQCKNSEIVHLMWKCAFSMDTLPVVAVLGMLFTIEGRDVKSFTEKVII